jgi:hypothetical protein
MLVQDSRAHLAREPNKTRCKSVGGSEAAIPSRNRMSFPASFRIKPGIITAKRRVLQIVATVMGDVIPFPYRLFFLYIEPVSAFAGMYYAAIHPSDYLFDLVSPIQGDFSRAALDTPTRMTLFQLSNLYLLFALNEHLVLSSTSSLKTWRRLLFCLLVADFGHLATMIPAGTEIFWNVSKWNAMAWGSVGFVYLGASLRLCFLAGVGLERSLNANKVASKVVKAE